MLATAARYAIPVPPLAAARHSNVAPVRRRRAGSRGQQRRTVSARVAPRNVPPADPAATQPALRPAFGSLLRVPRLPSRLLPVERPPRLPVRLPRPP